MFARMLRRRSMTPPRRVGRRRRLTRRAKRLAMRIVRRATSSRSSAGNVEKSRSISTSRSLLPGTSSGSLSSAPSSSQPSSASDSFCSLPAGPPPLARPLPWGAGAGLVSPSRPLPLLGVELPERLEAAIERRSLLDAATRDRCGARDRLPGGPSDRSLRGPAPRPSARTRSAAAPPGADVSPKRSVAVRRSRGAVIDPSGALCRHEALESGRTGARA